ncbi:beta-glucosidase BglX [Puteibacter caeruleilacunae]|nr:beta-glucosidase BglX [Puteibacter caeruleilacunae]
MKLLRLSLCLVISLLFAGVHAQGQKQTSNAAIEKKIDKLLKKMTLEEKIGQMCQVNISPKATEVPQKIKDAIRAGKIGSILNAGSPDMIAEIQRIALNESNAKIPVIIGRDVIHGFNTVFPIPLGQAASWNRELVEKGAAIAAQEASEVGINWTFAPMLDVSRDPRWGRIAESLGEDPCLVSELGSAMVKGFQGETRKFAACAKHFVGYGATENGKDYNPVFIPINQLRNVYLPPFQKAIETGCATVMTAFNDIDGTPASGNEFLLKQVLRNEWSFKGFVVSDWNSMTQMKSQGFCADDKDVALKSANAGLDMEMVSTTYTNHLSALVKEGKVDLETIDTAVRNILRIKYQLNLFDDPYSGLPNNVTTLCSQHKQAAKAIATQSIVLLKNQDQLLPLSSNKKIAVIGPMADAQNDQMGCWAMDGVADDVVTPLTALKKQFGANIKYAKGIADCRTNDKSLLSEAVNIAKLSDVILYFGGEDAILSGEGHSRAFINLPGAQEELISTLAKTGKPIVLVIMAGRPLTFNKAAEKAAAIMYAWHPGTMGGEALADLITGKAVPSGKLPVTFPKTLGQVPIYYGTLRTGRPANWKMLGIPTGTPLDPVGLSNNYLDVSVLPAYPFGYGLSYTTFKYDKLKASSNEISKNKPVKIQVEVQNTGKVEADEIVQLYIRDEVASVMQPKLALKDFKRVTLKPQENKTVVFTLTADMLEFIKRDGQVTYEPGSIKVFVGANSQELLEVKIQAI